MPQFDELKVQYGHKVQHDVINQKSSGNVLPIVIEQSDFLFSFFSYPHLGFLITFHLFSQFLFLIRKNMKELLTVLNSTVIFLLSFHDTYNSVFTL